MVIEIVQYELANNSTWITIAQKLNLLTTQKATPEATILKYKSLIKHKEKLRARDFLFNEIFLSTTYSVPVSMKVDSQMTCSAAMADLTNMITQVGNDTVTAVQDINARLGLENQAIKAQLDTSVNSNETLEN